MLSGLDSAWLEKILGEFCGRIWHLLENARCSLDWIQLGWKKSSESFVAGFGALILDSWMSAVAGKNSEVFCGWIRMLLILGWGPPGPNGPVPSRGPPMLNVYRPLCGPEAALAPSSPSQLQPVLTEPALQDDHLR